MPGQKDILSQLFKYIEDRDEIQVEALLTEKGADPNGENALGYTPLMWACEYSSYEVVKLLIAHGGDINRLTEKKRTPLSFAISGNNLPVVKLLIEKGVNLDQRIMDEEYTCLSYAARQGYRDICQVLVKHGVDASLTDKQGKTAIDLAQESDFLQTAKFLETSRTAAV